MELPSKKSRKSYDELTLNAALSAIKDGEMSIRKASVTFSIPKSTLSDRISGKVSVNSLQ